MLLKVGCQLCVAGAFDPIRHFQGYYCKKLAAAAGSSSKVKPDTWLVA